MDSVICACRGRHVPSRRERLWAAANRPQFTYVEIVIGGVLASVLRAIF